MHGIWRNILSSAPSRVSLDESFFDLGGHSILATRLIFEIRKTFVVSAPLSLVFDHPTIRSQAAELDRLRNSDLGLLGDSSTGTSQHLAPSAHRGEVATAVGYSNDFEKLLLRLPNTYTPLPSDFSSRPLTVFLTGATGFLGAFILRDLLLRESRVSKVFCLVRAKDDMQAMQRLSEGSVDRGVWDSTWVTSGRLETLAGDLAMERFGLVDSTWQRIAAEADVILHNGAFVSISSPNNSLIPLNITVQTGALGLPV